MNYHDLTRQYAAYAAQQGETPFYVTDYGTSTRSYTGFANSKYRRSRAELGRQITATGTADEQMFSNQTIFLGWIDDRRNTLIAMNQDNVVLEDGDMHLRGNEKIMAGSYVQVNYGNQLSSMHYAHGVTHTFEPFGATLLKSNTTGEPISLIAAFKVAREPTLSL